MAHTKQTARGSHQGKTTARMPAKCPAPDIGEIEKEDLMETSEKIQPPKKKKPKTERKKKIKRKQEKKTSSTVASIVTVTLTITATVESIPPSTSISSLLTQIADDAIARSEQSQLAPIEEPGDEAPSQIESAMKQPEDDPTRQLIPLDPGFEPEDFRVSTPVDLTQNISFTCDEDTDDEGINRTLFPIDAELLTPEQVKSIEAAQTAAQQEARKIYGTKRPKAEVLQQHADALGIVDPGTLQQEREERADQEEGRPSTSRGKEHTIHRRAIQKPLMNQN